MSSRVLLLSHHHPDLVRGGAQQFCYELFEALQQTCYEPILLASVQRNTHPQMFKDGAHITGFSRRRNEFLYLCYGYDHEWHRNREPAGLEHFEAFLRQVEPEVIHFHHFIYFGLEFFTAARRYLDKIGGRLIFTFHEFLPICMADGLMVRKFNNSLCNRASPVRCTDCFPHLTPEFFTMREMWIRHHLDLVDLFVCPSQFLSETYEAWGIIPEKMRKIPYGRQLHGRAERLPSSRKRQHNRFAFFGQLIDNKGLLVLFDAIRILRSRGIENFTLDIRGANLNFASQEFQRDFKAFFEHENTSSKNEPPRVRLHENYAMSDLAGLMANIDWVIVPSIWWENSPMVILEAFMFGKPVICSNIGGMAEHVRDSVDGLLFSVRNSGSLADVMCRALSEEGLWNRLHESIVPPPSAEVVAQRHIELCYTPTHEKVSLVLTCSDDGKIGAV